MSGNLADLRTLIFDIQVFKYLNVSSIALYMFDSLLTFPDEVRYVWGSRWSLGTTAYVSMYCRYVPSRHVLAIRLLLGSILSYKSFADSNCKGLYVGVCLSGWALSQPVAVVICLRTYALYLGTRWAKVFVALAGCAWFVASTVSIALLISKTHYVLPPIHDYTCLFTIQTAPPSLFILIDVAASVYVLSLTILAIYKVLKHAMLGHSGLVKIMLRDGVAFILMTTVLNMTALLLTLSAPPEHATYKSMLSSLVGVTSALVMCRVLINLRKYASGGIRGDGFTNGGLSVVGYAVPNLGQPAKMSTGEARRETGMIFAPSKPSTSVSCPVTTQMSVSTV